MLLVSLFLSPVLGNRASRWIHFVVLDYLDGLFGGESLWPSDPYKKAVAKTLVSDFGVQVSHHIEEMTDLSFHSFCSSRTTQFVPNYYKYFGKANDEKTAAGIVKFLQVMEQHITKSGGKFLMGEQIGAADYLLWPWMERLEACAEFLGEFSHSVRAVHSL